MQGSAPYTSACFTCVMKCNNSGLTITSGLLYRETSNVGWVPLAGSRSSATRNCALVKRTMCLIDGSEGGGACAKISFISSLASSVFEPQCLQPSTDTISVSPPSVCNMQRVGIRNGNPESLEIRYSDGFNKEVMACG